MLRRASQIRSFASAALIRNQIKYPSFIHDALKDLPHSRQNKTLPKARKRILILSPEETKDKKFSQLLKDVNKKGKRALARPMMKLIDEESPADSSYSSTHDHASSDNVEFFKPSTNEVSLSKKKATVRDLCKAFTKQQLLAYVEEKKSATRGLKSATKQKIASFIFEKVWSTKSSGLSSLDDVFVTERIPLSRLELFLLLLSNGSILKHIRSAVAKIEFDSKTKKLLLTGTPHQVENAKINLTLDLESAHKEEIDLSEVKKFAMELHGEFDVKEVSNNTEVYFDQLKDDKFEVHALNKNQLKRTKRLILWLLNYNLHGKDFLHLPENSASLRLLPYKDDESLPWKDRNRDLYVIERTSNQPSKLLLEELAKFADEELDKVELNDDDWRDEDNYISLKGAAQEKVDESGWDLLESLGFGSEKKETTQDVAPSKPTKPILISLAQRDQMYQELTDFEYRKHLPGVSEDKLDPKLFTITLGNVVFEMPSPSADVLPPVRKVDEHQKYLFNSNVPLALDNLLRLQPELDEAEFFRDPHTYRLQFKFTPSPFPLETNSQNTTDHMKYPPVEIWIQMKSNHLPDVDTLQVVSVEGENSSHCCLPEAKSDLKITCQMTGQVLLEEETTSEEPSSIAEALESTIERYQRFESQPGVVDFLQKSHLDFSGKSPLSIAPTIDLVIGGKTVRYHYLNVSYRKEIALEVPNADDSSSMVLVSIVEGGSLGGKRIEIRFVGDFTKDNDREQFDTLLDRVLEFINTL